VSGDRDQTIERDGYEAVQLHSVHEGEAPDQKAELGHLKKADAGPMPTWSSSANEAAELQLGETVTVESFA